MKSYTLSFNHYYWATLIPIWSDERIIRLQEDVTAWRHFSPVTDLLQLLSQRNGDYVSVQVEN